MRHRQRGIVLILVSWILVLGAVLALSVSGSSRSETRQVSAALAAAQAQAAAESGVWLAVNGLVNRAFEGWPIDGTATEHVVHGTSVQVIVQAQSGLVDLNAASETLLNDVITNALEDEQRGAALSDEILDWRDADQLVRLHGAEVDSYLDLERAAAPRDGPFNSVEQLRRLATISEAEYRRLAPLFTVHSQREAVTAELAPEVVLRALPGVSVEQVEALLQARAARRDSADEPALKRRPRAPRGQAYEIFAEAQSGVARRRVSAVIVQRGRQRPPYAVLAWREGWYDRRPMQNSSNDGETP